MFGRKSSRKDDPFPELGRTADLGILLLRLGAGGLLAGHGAQKVSTAFGGHGLEGTAGWMESMGLTPGKTWAALAGASELGGGLLTALGLAWPVGPISIHGAMATATRQMHWGKPIWVTAGGAELPVLYGVTAYALQFTGPGKYALDNALGIKIPKGLAVLTGIGVVAGIVLQEMQTSAAATEEAADSGADASGEADTDSSNTTGENQPSGETDFAI